MSLKFVHKKLLKIKGTASKNAKTLLLTESLLNDEVFKRVIVLMYNDSMHFKVQKLPPFSPPQGAFAEKATTSELFSFLDQLAEQKGASNEDKRSLARLASIDKETYDVVKRIVNKDAKCGFGGKTINKAFKDLLFLMPYCRCSTEKKKMHNIDYERGAIGQEKADGMFSNIIVSGDSGDYSSLIRSRSGNIVHQMKHLHDMLWYLKRKFSDTVYMGELLIMINGKILPRKTGNGYLNSCLQNAAPSDKAEHAIIKLWDAVPEKNFWAGKCNIQYKYRLARVKNMVKSMKSPLLTMIQSKILYSEEEARVFYKELRAEGKEGAIIKNQHALWKDHTSPDCVKLKNKSDAELRVVSWRYGKEDTKYSEVVGSVQLASDDGLVKVSVSGFSDAERLEDWDARIGKVGTLEYEGLISDKSRPGIYSLYLPQNLEMRPDRTTTDTLKDLKTR